MSNEALKKAIQQIYADSSLTSQEKSKKVQSLMTQSWKQAQETAQATKVSEIKLLQETASYHNAEEKTLGCKHYERSCKIKAKCCGLLFVCRLCHDDVQDHKIDRYATEEMLCMYCNTLQAVGQTCRSCEKPMAAYYCGVCKFWENRSTFQVYHCDRCGLCRRGQGLGIDFQHCDGCNACLNLETFNSHKCIEGLLQSNCPICHEWMHNSTMKTTFLPCGHPMHVKCFNSFARTAYQCPTCLKSVADMSSFYDRIDNYLEDVEIPEVYRSWTAQILCNDCLKKTTVPYKLAYHKCGECSSYNTDVMKINKD